MLLQFTVENFLSFQEKSTFSMVAAREDQQHPAHLVTDEAGRIPPVLRAAAIYGANGAGKSNLVRAVYFARNLILKGAFPGQSLPITPFKLGSDPAQPSRFEFIFSHKDVLYSYGFVLTPSRILEEWLYATPGRKEVRYFERTTSEEGKVSVEFGRTFVGRSKEQEQFLGFVARATRPNQLFLTEARNHNVREVAPLFAWFETILIVITAEAKNAELEFRSHKSADFTQFLCKLLRKAGTGIEGIITEETHDVERYLPDMDLQSRWQLSQSVAALEENTFLVLELSTQQRYIFTRDAFGEPVLVLFKTQHRAHDGTLVSFTMEEESEGTQRLIHLAPALFAAGEMFGKVLLLDELDRRLHPLLSRLFVQMALEGEEVNRRSQLLFTTHETNLLDLDLLRRDEIWFVEKDKYGASHIYSLAEFKIRPDLKVEKGYLNGRFGAIPFPGDVRSLGWTEEEYKPTVEV